MVNKIWKFILHSAVAAYNPYIQIPFMEEAPCTDIMFHNHFPDDLWRVDVSNFVRGTPRGLLVKRYEEPLCLLKKNYVSLHFVILRKRQIIKSPLVGSCSLHIFLEIYLKIDSKSLLTLMIIILLDLSFDDLFRVKLINEKPDLLVV